MRFRGKNSLPLTPKTVHLLRLPRTIGKRKGDDNKFFSPILRANHQCLAATLNRAFPGIAYQWVVFFPEKATGFSFRRLNLERLVPGLAVAWIENNSPSQNQPGHNSNPVPNCLNAQQFNGALLRNRISKTRSRISLIFGDRNALARTQSQRDCGLQPKVGA